jgi:hypothetical protein
LLQEVTYSYILAHVNVLGAGPKFWP